MTTISAGSRSTRVANLLMAVRWRLCVTGKCASPQSPTPLTCIHRVCEENAEAPDMARRLRPRPSLADAVYSALHQALLNREFDPGEPPTELARLKTPTPFARSWRLLPRRTSSRVERRHSGRRSTPAMRRRSEPERQSARRIHRRLSARRLRVPSLGPTRSVPGRSSRDTLGVSGGRARGPATGVGADQGRGRQC
jgi:hypothetical protein